LNTTNDEAIQTTVKGAGGAAAGGKKGFIPSTVEAPTPPERGIIIVVKAPIPPKGAVNVPAGGEPHKKAGAAAGGEPRMLVPGYTSPFTVLPIIMSRRSRTAKSTHGASMLLPNTLPNDVKNS